MNPRTTTILGWLTLIAVLVAIWLTLGEEQPPREKPGKLWPDLATRINDAARIAISHEGRNLVIRRDGDVWRIEQKEGYPADDAKVRRFLTSLVRTEILARKTDRPADYPRLKLDEASAAHLVVSDARGKPIVDAFLGKREFKFRARRFETFLRKAGDPRVYLVTGIEEPKAEPKPWYPDSILSIDFSRIAAITIRHADGETLTISRPEPGADFVLAEMKKDEVFKGYRPLDHIANAFSYVAIEDVRRDDGTAPGKPVGRLRLETFDGLVVTIEAFWAGDESEDQWWRIRASRRPGSEEATQKTAEKDEAGKEKGKEKAEEDGTEKAEAGKPDVAAELARLKLLGEGWLIRISKHVGDDIFRHKDRIVSPAEKDKGDKKAAGKNGS
ncbi:MAG: DUF4340 domain-containing protein [Alphaproteobacteria bacterium]|nr:MAG: DUF4340 domain-containing protein [Alphaproteobacteria bacterium]